MKIILASKSPRRKEILESLGINFEIIVSDIDESSSVDDPAELVCLLSERKGTAVAKIAAEKFKNQHLIVISSDTVVACENCITCNSSGKFPIKQKNEIFGKPTDKEDAERMLRSLSGRTHKVFSGISLTSVSKNGEIKTFTDFESTCVTFKKMSDSDIGLYLSHENVLDKAGAYAIQGMASLWIDSINGNYFNVVGLPVNKLVPLARKAGLEISDLIK